MFYLEYKSQGISIKLPTLLNCGNTELIESGEGYWRCDVNLKRKQFFVDRAPKDDIPFAF